MTERLELERKAEIMVRNARAALIMSRPFYGVLVSQVTAKMSWDFPTAATNSVTHFFNPKFVSELTPAKVKGTQAHETEHDARHHATRRGNRDPQMWNEACDYEINPDLVDEGFELPEGFLYREDFRGLVAEEIYRVLQIEKAKKQQEEEDRRKQQEQSKDDESEEGSGKGDDKDDKAEDEEAGDETGDDGDGGPSRSSNPEDGSDGDADEGDGDSGDEADGEEADGDGGSGDGAGDGEGEDGEASGAGSNGGGDGEPKSVVGDVGGCGEVLDAPGSEAEKADLDTKWEVATRTAVAMAKKRGDLPGHWASIIEKRKTPTQDWRSILREYINAGARNIQTFNRPNRRLAHSGIVWPGNQRDGINKVCFIIDASGSMYGQHVKVANELQAAMDDGSISETVLIYCDTRVYHVDRFTAEDRIEFGPITHGGTDMRPAFDLIEQEESDASLIICLTDLEIGDPGREPEQPVLWMAYGDPRIIKAYGDRMPWGKVLDVDNE